MARTIGTRNRDFEDKHSAILDALAVRLLAADGPRVTLHEMATSAGVSASSLRHHVGGRGEVWAAVVARWAEQGSIYLAALRQPTPLPAEESIHATMRGIAFGLESGLGRILAAGVAAGVHEPVAGPAFLERLLEPLLQALEARLGWHVACGELQPHDTRISALSLASPLVLAALHQQALGGCAVRPLALLPTAEALAAAFLAAHRRVPTHRAAAQQDA